MISIQSHILIVDDELFFRNLYKDLLSEDAYRVDICASGDEAIQLLAQSSYDLVVTDMVMPGKDGFDILHAARSLAEPADVILVTGHATLETAIEALKSGARDYLIKPFNPAELRHLVKNCLEQRRLLVENDELRQQVRLFQSAQSLSALIDFESLLPQALGILMRETGAGVGLSLHISATQGTVLNRIDGFDGKRAQDVAQEILQKLADVPADEFSLRLNPFYPVELTSVTYHVLPLLVEQRVRAAIVLGGVSEAGGALLKTRNMHYLCEQVVLGFDNACRYQSAQQLMYTDDLTGLFNYRYMQVALTQEMRRSQRYGLKFSLLFMDLDHFKNINDTHGHLAGSAALTEVALVLRQCVREVDTLFRFGGDEFAALLVETDAGAARKVAERIRTAIDGHTFLAAQGYCCHVTMTTGYATYPTDAIEQERLLDMADQAMYEGKRLRNVIRGVADIR